MRYCKVGVWTTVAAGLLAGALFLNGCGQKVAAPEPFEVVKGGTVTPVSTRYSMSGTVLDQSGNPVAGAYVTIGTKRVTSGADGSYTFTGLLPGTYRVVASSDGYIVNGITAILTAKDEIGKNITITSFSSDLLPNAEDVRGTETVEISEGVTTGTKTIVSGVPVGPAEDAVADFPAALVVEPGVTIRDAQGGKFAEAPNLSVIYLDQSQCPLPSTGTFGMRASNVYQRSGPKQTAEVEYVTESGVQTDLTVENSQTLLNKDSVVRATNIPLSGFVLEANGKQGATFDKPQLFIVNPGKLKPPMDLSNFKVGTQLRFADPAGKITYGTLREDGAIELRVTKLTTYLMQGSVNFDVTDSEFTTSLGNTPPAAKLAEPSQDVTGWIMNSIEFFFADDISDLEKAMIRFWIESYLGLGELERITTEVTFGQGLVINGEVYSHLSIEIVLGGIPKARYEVWIRVVNGQIVDVKIVIDIHESGGAA